MSSSYTKHAHVCTDWKVFQVVKWLISALAGYSVIPSWTPVGWFRFCTHIFANEVLLVLHDAPGGDADGADLPSGLGGVVFQSVSHMANHP